MPKAHSKLTINLDLLKPQSNPEQLSIKILRWLLASGRYIFVFVEAIVLVAFVARFKLDADLAAKKEAIEEQIPYIESLRPYEILIRETQLKLSTIDNARTGSLDWPGTLKKIADQVPTSVKLTSINIVTNVSNTTINMSGQTTANGDLINFLAGLKQDAAFSDVNLSSIGVDQGVMKFTVSASAKITGSGGKSI